MDWMALARQYIHPEINRFDLIIVFRNLSTQFQVTKKRHLKVLLYVTVGLNIRTNIHLLPCNKNKHY